ncbi:class I SAM-dependent methyltransferase [Mycobacterium sp. CVI_P3]|uniref:S-adenosyl-L-methionine-dependent methyltransferase n=1 Tax=Mycobacterium pinniadriaticum TaxID=2994102 RepID=A0ABT3SNL4_9MYCO|nr:class I SAM-dependent methyltransferase [Mycobacterium pinniadriaticum]MCX2934683.1 class I SAM-dependent methyltransferase [Mycobacterium pinniadriaticum]MCX2941105.1 class I SAM-dependent methyltransferase [Mycobacterium pinniadriaticum]
MTRSDADSWDLATSVGTTATMVAAARAVASREENALIDDPFAAPLVRAVGIDIFTKIVDGDIDMAAVDTEGTAQVMTDVMAVRTRFFDDFFLEAGRAGVRQAVILASGLDSRSYRLAWPAGMMVYEIDQPKVIEFKTETLATLGASPTAELRMVSVDLREDWPAALRAKGFDDTKPTAWSAEGLLAYLPPDAQDRLFDNITALSAPGSRLATEYHPDGGAGIADRSKMISDRWRDLGLDLNMADLFYTGERNAVPGYLEGQGWQVSARSRAEMFALHGREFAAGDLNATLRNSSSVTAIRK